MHIKMGDELKGQRVLVTGGAGFVGSNLVRRLVAEGAEVTILDDFFTGRMENLEGIPAESYRLVRGSVTDGELVWQLVAEAELIFHLAARNIIASTHNPYEDFKTNIGGTLNVLLAARNSHPRRVIYTSSVSVYGNPRYLPINEDDRISLLTPYAVSKYSGEGYCQAFYESYDVPVVVCVIRMSMVPGRTRKTLTAGSWRNSCSELRKGYRRKFTGTDSKLAILPLWKMLLGQRCRRRFRQNLMARFSTSGRGWRPVWKLWLSWC